MSEASISDRWYKVDANPNPKSSRDVGAAGYIEAEGKDEARNRAKEILFPKIQARDKVVSDVEEVGVHVEDVLKKLRFGGYNVAYPKGDKEVIRRSEAQEWVNKLRDRGE